MAPTTIYEADIEHPATGQTITVRSLSLAELEVDIDLAFGALTDLQGRDAGAVGEPAPPPG